MAHAKYGYLAWAAHVKRPNLESGITTDRSLLPPLQRSPKLLPYRRKCRPSQLERRSGVPRPLPNNITGEKPVVQNREFKILAISRSIRTNSYNKGLIRTAQEV